MDKETPSLPEGSAAPVTAPEAGAATPPAPGATPTDPASKATGAGAPDVAPERAIAAHRQLRTIGITLFLAAALLLAMFTMIVVRSAQGPQPDVWDHDGGDLTVQVDPALGNASVAVAVPGEGVLARQETDANGRTHFAALDQAGLTVTVTQTSNATQAPTTWVRNVWAPADEEVTLDLTGPHGASDAEDDWIGWPRIPGRAVAYPVAILLVIMAGATAMILRRGFWLMIFAGALTVGAALQGLPLFGPLMALALAAMGIWSIVIARRARPLIGAAGARA